MRKRLILTGLLAGLSFLAGPSAAKDKGASDDKSAAAAEEKSEKRAGKMARELGLNEEQVKKLKEHRKAHRAEGKTLRDELAAKRQALRAELEKASFDEGKVKAAAASLQAARNRLADHMIDGVIEVRRILTAEQFKKFLELREKRSRSFFGRRRGPDGMPDRMD